ncbi:MAG TPA: hypothetical protein VJ124_05315 [Pyrinomonadaceae bacterium]|nr:hypothetical protein [Pyrinomonadaceae bacterium]
MASKTGKKPPGIQIDAPLPSNNGVATGHAVYVLFSGVGTIKQYLKDYGIFFEAEVDDDGLHCMLVDPRFGVGSVLNYIVALGGTVYESPPEPEV